MGVAILVSNDDGILAPGIRALAEAVAPFGEVIVVAPDTERSASSHAITLHANLRVREMQPNWYAVSGTPVDSVYFGALHVCRRLPDLVVSGINDGFNLGSDTIYSGTVAAAREGRLRGASALAVSAMHRADPKIAIPYVRALVPALLERHQAGERHLLNVNVPAHDPTVALLPLRVCPLGQRRYRDTVEERHDLMGRPYYWIGGPPSDEDGDEDTDTRWIRKHAVTITPIQLDATAHDLPAWAEWTRTLQ